MYDKFSLKLEAAQFLLGNDLELCRKALTSHERDTLHLVERINMDFQVQNSIVPSALNLARFKVAGKLPTLQVNFSDTKYKTLMRLIDVTIPKFDDDVPVQPAITAAPVKTPRPEITGRSVSGPFTLWSKNQEYNVEDSDDDEGDDANEDDDAQFFDVEGSNAPARPELHQHTFELAFSVDQLKVLVSKSTGGQEKALGDLSLERFALDFALAKYDMQVDVRLR
jgi:vacuolar protein sorting-associated protein 13A/C